MDESTKTALVWFAMIFSAAMAHTDFTSECPAPCECKWLSGNKAATCVDLTAIPNKLSSDIQNLNVSHNKLHEITQNAFEEVGLINLKKLYLRSCQIITIHKDGFKNLRILIEIDLSRNNIQILHADTFIDLEKIRIINLGDNQLEKLHNGLFKELRFLQNVDLNNNNIHTIGADTFTNLPKLITVNLSYNNLTHLNFDTFHKNVSSLTSLVLRNNPWNCDCNLQSFRNWISEKNLYTHPTSCAEPSRLHNRNWNELESNDFACKPRIIEPLQGTAIQATGENITMSCKVMGNPKPDVTWAQNTITIDGMSRKYADNRLVIKRSDLDLTVWVNLTIINVRYQDKGDYTCVAKNPGGSETRSISLTVNRVQGIVGAGVGANESLFLIVGLSVGAVLLLVVIVLLCYCFCRKRDYKRPIKSDMHSSNGEALIEGSVIPEMEKSLITTVNPVTKPPRRYDPPICTGSGGTEMSELNKTLLDSDSVFAPNEDESRSMDFADHHPKRSRDAINVSTSGQGDQRTYPPDLLSFPPRGGQASPAASSASTAPDSTRLPQQIQQQSPMHSPIYGTNPNLFKTISHSRSQSPFTSPCAPAPLPRMGYVTIPRRPRIPSWASTASYMTVVAPVEGVEPVYDNLGLRTTADGSSVLSLNKAGLEQPLSPGSMRGRPLPSTPGSYQAPIAVMYAPIEEQEQAPSPAPSTPYSSTLPRIGSNSMHFQLSPSLHDLEQRTNRLKEASDLAAMKRFAPADKNQSYMSNGSAYDTSMNESTYDTLPSSRSGKIPPRPPPKPKKKSPSDPNGPLFEDEGEDGTEV